VLESADEFPDVLRRPLPREGESPVTAALSVSVTTPGASATRKVRYAFEVAKSESCDVVRVLRGEANLRPPARVSVEWDGKDDSGKPLPDGEYAYRADVEFAGDSGSSPESARTRFHAVRLTGLSSSDECTAAAHQAHAVSTSTTRDEKLQRDLAFCASPGASYCEAMIVAQANGDRRAAVLRYLAGTFSTSQELAVNHDRTEKLDRAQRDPGLLAAICAGDGDGDMVPDSTDACPDTPPLTATTDDGCTDPALPNGPDRRHVDAILAAMGVVHDERCNGATAPATSGGRFLGSIPVAIVYCQVDSRGKKGLVLSAVTNQPPGCAHFYDLKVHVEKTDGTSFDAFLTPRAETLTPLTGRSGRAYAMLEFGPGDPGALGEWARADVAFVTASVRGVNGSGLSSPWSTPGPVTVAPQTNCAPAVAGDL
jgi:hypothetical protein